MPNKESNMYTIRKVRSLDPDNAAQMDAFNEEYAKACKELNIPREQMNVTFEQAAEYLRISPATVQRYCYAAPPTLELAHDMVDRGFVKKQKAARVTLDSVVESVVWLKFNRLKKEAK